MASLNQQRIEDNRRKAALRAAEEAAAEGGALTDAAAARPPLSDIYGGAPAGPALEGETPPIRIDQGQPQAAPAAPPGPTVGEQPQGDAAQAQMAEVAKQSDDIVSRAGETEAKRVTEQLEETGGVDVESAYDQLVEKMGGFKSVDTKMTKAKKGLFLMDFGMRLMQASSKWNAQLGGAIGEAGQGAMQNLQAQNVAQQQSVEAYNKQLHDQTLGVLKEQREAGTLLGPEDTTEGLFQPPKYATGVTRPMESPGEGVLQQDPLSRRGGRSGPLQVQVLKKWYKDLGYSEEESVNMATGAKNTLRSLQDYVDEIWKRKREKPNTRATTPDGRRIKFDEWEDTDVIASAKEMYNAVRTAAGELKAERMGAL